MSHGSTYVHSSGWLRVDYPNGWAVKEYPDDPRAKVQLSDPKEGDLVRLILTPADGRPLDQVLPDLEERRAQMLTMATRVEFSRHQVRGVPAVRIEADLIVRRRQVLYLFVQDDIFCNFCFEAALNRFDTCWPRFERFLADASLGRPAPQSAEVRMEQVAASRITRGEKALACGNFVVAKLAVEEGLGIAPSHPGLRDLAARVEAAAKVASADDEISPVLVARRKFQRLHALLIGTLALLPFLGLVAIDVTQEARWLAPALIAVPFLDLRRQLRAWLAHVRAFGIPPLASLKAMVAIDALRAYDPLTDRTDGQARQSMWGGFGATLLFGLASLAIGAYFGWFAPAYVTSCCVMLACKAVVRRSRPPAVLLLSTSDNATLLQHSINASIEPLLVTSLVRHLPISPLHDTRLQFQNFRTGSDTDWCEVVQRLVSVSGLTVLDLRGESAALNVEREICAALPDKRRLVVVADRPPPGFDGVSTVSANQAAPAIRARIVAPRPRIAAPPTLPEQ